MHQPFCQLPQGETPQLTKKQPSMKPNAPLILGFPLTDPRHFFEGEFSSRHPLINIPPPEVDGQWMRIIKDAQDSVRPYQNWNQWVASDYCFLFRIYQQLIEGVLHFVPLHDLAESLSLPPKEIEFFVYRVVTQLNENLPLYTTWLCQKSMIDGKGMVVYDPFLDASLFTQGLPSRVFQILLEYGKTFREVLKNCPDGAISKIPGIGPTRLHELTELFCDYGQCSLVK